MTRRHRSQRGTMAVELVLLAPVLVCFLLLVVAGGRYVGVQGDVDAAARDAARAASLQSSRSDAYAAAVHAVAAQLEGSSDCAPLDFGGDFEAGGEVVIRLSCRVSYSGLGLIGLPGHVTITSESASPLDPYRRIS